MNIELSKEQADFMSCALAIYISMLGVDEKNKNELVNKFYVPIISQLVAQGYLPNETR